MTTYEVYPTKAKARERAIALHKDGTLVMITPTEGGDSLVISIKGDCNCGGAGRFLDEPPPSFVERSP